MNCGKHRCNQARLEPHGSAGLFAFPGVPVVERLAFALSTLADAANAPRPITGCPNGHLVVGHSHWAPESFAVNLATITCRLVEDCDTHPTAGGVT
jgi:hypothetical protein